MGTTSITTNSTKSTLISNGSKSSNLLLLVLVEERIALRETNSRDALMRINGLGRSGLLERHMRLSSSLLLKIAEVVPVLFVGGLLRLVIRHLRSLGVPETLDLWFLDLRSSRLLVLLLQIRLFISTNCSTLCDQILEVLFTDAACFTQASLNIEATLLAVAGGLASTGLVTALSLLAILGLVGETGLLGELWLAETFQVAEVTLDVLCSLIVIAAIAWGWSSDMRSSLLESWLGSVSLEGLWLSCRIRNC